MALPSLIKFIYNHGTEEVIRRGKKIFNLGGVQKLRIDELSANASFRVRNDLYQNHYTVNVNRFEEEAFMNVRCQCPYNMGEICRHEVAALFYLNELITTNQIVGHNAEFDQSLTLVRMRQIELKTIRLFTSAENFSEAGQISLHYPSTIQSAFDEKVTSLFTMDGGEYTVILKRNDDKTFSTSCNCIDANFALCKHKTALFLQLVNNYGSGYFDTIRNWDTQKNKLLQLYGYTLSDNLDGKFEFTYIDEKPILKVLDAGIKKINTTPNAPETSTLLQKDKVAETSTNKRIGLVVNANATDYPYFTLDVVEGEWDGMAKIYADKVATLDITKYISLDNYQENEKTIIATVRKLMPKEVHRFLARSSQYGEVWDNIISDDILLDNRKAYLDYAIPKISKIFSLLGDDNPCFMLPTGKKFVTAQLVRVKAQITPLKASFKVSGSLKKLKISARLHNAITNIDAKDNPMGSSMMYLNNKDLFLVADAATALYLNDLIWEAKTQDPEYVLNKVLLPLSKEQDVVFETEIIQHEVGSLDGINIHLSEGTDSFIMKPIFRYGKAEAIWDGSKSIQISVDNQIKIIQRDTISENAWIDQLLKLNEHFKSNPAQSNLHIHGKYLLQGNTFFKLFEKLKEWKINIFGFETLKKFKIRSSKPSTLVSISSGQDWFDTEVNIEFEGVGVNLEEIRKSLKLRQNFVLLQDGTYGLLPEEWLTKYSLLFKMSDVNGNKLRVSKYNFTVIDELHDAINDESIQAELMEKKKFLIQTDPQEIAVIDLPINVHADLRPYQHSGYQWLHYLHKVGWGGLLADDMGLGKTLQALVLLQYLKEKKKNIQALIVCPTTLLYNWQAESEKFTPELTKLIHHGSGRTAKQFVLGDVDLIITTYGTLRSDAEMLSKIDWDYVILDESQAIKNPTSKVTKAAMLLKAKNRLALSGTPLQNNTFDLFAQMNFLNPGMLGNKEFFKDSFAMPIDKFQEASTKEHLRKLVFPFLLRRTKEQVAKDLPDKTEITLYCDMLPEQRKLYDAFKMDYRAKILGTIDSVGVGRSQLTILQGLTKLRQICDSPAILNEPVIYENHSVKLNELVRELQENLSDHKVLVFSQFLGMLGLIREKLTEQKINFEYFDGSYTSKQRQAAIENFQNNPECKVFLISLKAGGTGLNLTAADYVYIMDPWWNPAVEQQAIDRTHRIGQTKNIFAYRFICKDSVEEKIVALKQKKNALVREIIADDDGFVKQLTRADVEYLFS
jgi:SNF2 family DNA or RNA helicase